jgi:hypothetical protein
MRGRIAERRPIGLRWTLGDVAPPGYEALRLSIWGAWKLFGPAARYAVCVNTIDVETAKARVGPAPDGLIWHDSRNDVPHWLLRGHVDPKFAEGVAWKFAPVRLFPDCYELSLDNDVILWEIPTAILDWLEPGAPCLIAEDVRACFGQFTALCGGEPRNSGIRGLAPGYDLESRLRAMLGETGIKIRQAVDEQGLQVAALEPDRPHVVSVEEVTICSPFPPHRDYLGRCGAHFVGLNDKHYPWSLDGLPAEVYVERHWRQRQPILQQRVGMENIS